MEDMSAMVKMLAGAPEEQRRQMLAQRIEMFGSMPENQRVQGMVGMMTAINRLNPVEQRTVIKTRTAIVAGLPESKRKVILQSRMKAAMQVPKAVNDADMQVIQSVLPELPADLRQNFTGTQQEVMKAMGGGAMPGAGPARGGVPTHHDRPMALKGVFRKKYVCSVCGYTRPA